MGNSSRIRGKVTGSYPDVALDVHTRTQRKDATGITDYERVQYSMDRIQRVSMLEDGSGTVQQGADERGKMLKGVKNVEKELIGCRCGAETASLRAVHNLATNTGE
jgi:hypothetical protein